MPVEGFALWEWLLSGLGPWPYRTLFAVVVVTLVCGLAAALLRLLPVPFWDWIYYVVVAPVIEELICHLALVGWLMTLVWPCAAPQTTLLCGVTFGLMHIPGGLLRLIDGLILGFFNTIACLVYVRLLIPQMHAPQWVLWIAAYGALVLAHAVYNFLAQFFKPFPILPWALRAGGALFAIAAVCVWLPRLQ